MAGGEGRSGGPPPRNKKKKKKDIYAIFKIKFIVISYLVELFIYEWFVQIRAHTLSIFECFLQIRAYTLSEL